MKKLLITILLLTSTYAESIISVDLDGFAPQNTGVTYAYWMHDIYLKAGYGGATSYQNNITGSYNYTYLGVGWFLFEVYQKYPHNLKITTTSTDYTITQNSTNPITGFNLNLDLRSSTWIFGLYLGVEGPMPTYQEHWSSTTETESLGYGGHIGFRVGYTFGGVNKKFLKKRNEKVGVGMYLLLRMYSSSHFENFDDEDEDECRWDSDCSYDEECTRGKCVEQQYKLQRKGDIPRIQEIK